MKRRWDGYTVNISPAGDVTLRTPSGRSIGWYGKTDTQDAAADDFLATFPGTRLIDKRRSKHLQTT